MTNEECEYMAALEKERDELRDINHHLSNNLAKLETLERENAELRRLGRAVVDEWHGSDDEASFELIESLKELEGKVGRTGK